MRILLISHTCQSRTEGQPKAEQLGRRDGVELKVLAPDRWNHYGKPRGVDVVSDASFDLKVGKVRWPWVPGAQFYLHHYPNLSNILREFQPDVIDLWEEPWALVSAQACWLRNRLCPEARIICETEQNLDKQLPPPFEQMRRYVLAQSSFLVGRSQEAIEVATRKGYKGPAEVVPNGVDPDLFRPLPRAEARRRVLGEKLSGAFVAGYVGRLVQEKGLLEMVEALPLCSLDTHLVFVGEGPLREQLIARAGQLGMTDRVCVLPAHPLEELPAVMNALDVLVLPSRTTARWKEQFGRVIIEAHCAGTPVIGSSSGAIPTVVGEGGLVFPEGDVAALAEALRTLASDPARCRQMGEVGRLQALANCTWESVALRMERIYSRVLQARRTSSEQAENVRTPQLAMASLRTRADGLR